MRYFVVDAYDDCLLSNKVNQWISHGWVPQGGVSVTVVPVLCNDFYESEEPFVIYHQAVVHHDENPFYPGIDEWNE